MGGGDELWFLGRSSGSFKRTNTLEAALRRRVFLPWWGAFCSAGNCSKGEYRVLQSVAPKCTPLQNKLKGPRQFRSTTGRKQTPPRKAVASWCRGTVKLTS